MAAAPRAGRLEERDPGGASEGGHAGPAGRRSVRVSALMSAAAAAGEANPRAGGGAPGTSRPRANKTQTKHYVKGRHSSGGPRSCLVPAPPGRRTPGWRSRRSPCAPDAAAGPRPGWGRGRGARTPGTKGPHVPTRAHARPPARPRLAAPPPRKTPRAPPAPPRSRACALADSRARFKPAASPATACSGPRSCLIRGALDPFGREGNRSLSPSQNSNFPRPLPVPLELVKHVFPRTPLPASQAGPRCAFPPLPRCQLLFSRTARVLAQSCDLKRPVLFFS